MFARAVATTVFLLLLADPTLATGGPGSSTPPPMGGPPTQALQHVDCPHCHRGRYLPGSKTSTPASPPPAATPVSCSGSWSAWGACASTSGGSCPSSSGTQSRSFSISTYPSNGGSACPASPQSQSCTVNRNCAGSWSSYTTCTAAGQQARTYTVTCAASGSGSACEATNGQSQSRSCVPATDCVGSWGSWGACSATTSTQQATYAITSYQSGGGAACEATDGQTRSQSCTPAAVNCVGSWSSYSTCADSKQTSTYTITTAKSGAGTDCEATNGQTREQSCTMPAAPPAAVNCVGSWSEYSTCADSKQTSTYTITTAKSGAGTDCEAASGATQERSCTMPVSTASASSSVSGSVKVSGVANAAAVTPAMRTAIKTQIASYVDGVTAADVELAVSDAAAGEGRRRRRRRRRRLLTSTSGVIIRYTVKVANAATATSVAASLETATRTNLASDLITTVGGAFSTLATTDVAVFAPAASRTVGAAWTATGPGAGKHEYTVISCPLGSTVLLAWDTQNTAVQDNVYLMGSEEAYLKCDGTATGAYQVVTSAKDGIFSFPCSTPGTHFLASLAGSPASRCSSVKQRVRVHVSDPSQTESLRATLNPATGKNHYSLMKIMDDDIIPITAGGIPSEARANEILEHLWCAEPHSPAACADWIPAALNTNATCLAWLNTDIGFMLRKRPGNPDFAGAEDYYKRALALSPRYCPAESYYSELLVQRGDKTAAMAQFDKACTACGASTIDILDAQSTFEAKGWGRPPCPKPVGGDSTQMTANGGGGRKAPGKLPLSAATRSAAPGAAGVLIAVAAGMAAAAAAMSSSSSSSSSSSWSQRRV